MIKLLTLLLFLNSFLVSPAWATDYTAAAACLGSWLYTEGSGGTLGDSSGHSLNGSFAESINLAWTTTVPSFHILGSASHSLHFNPAESVDWGDADLWTIGGVNRSFILWFRLDTRITTNNTRMWLWTKGSSGAYEWAIGTQGDGTHCHLYFNEWTLAGDDIRIILGTTDLQVDTWYFCAVTKTSGNVFILYLNGASEGTDSTNLASSNGSSAVHLGTREWTVGTSLDGYLSESAFFSDVLTPTEINGIYDYGLKSAGGGATPRRRIILISKYDIHKNSIDSSRRLGDCIPSRRKVFA